jgi:hypothetical protein
MSLTVVVPFSHTYLIMSNSSNYPQPLGPLSVGNVISAALRIYRDRFSVYYKLAFLAYLWSIVPIYGWAKSMAISGLLSRLAYREVMGSPETVHEARRHVNPRLWTFFTTGLLIGLIFLGSILGYGIVVGIVSAILATFVQQNVNTATILLITLSAILAVIVFIFGYIWLYSRLSLSELPIAIEDQGIASRAIGRSWKLTKGFILRLQLIFFVAYLLTLPISVIVQIATTIIQIILASILPTNSPIYELVYFIISLMIIFAAGALLIPFWQAIKAVIYYDLRTRKEGIDLQLRDSR